MVFAWLFRMRPLLFKSDGGGGGGGGMLLELDAGIFEDGAGGGGGEGGSRCSKLFIFTFKLLFALLTIPAASGTGGGGGSESS